MPSLSIDITPHFIWAFGDPTRYKVWYGGRGGMKSWAIARLLIQRAYAKKTRILCTREYQSSIEDSVYRLLCDQIAGFNQSAAFVITKNKIAGLNGSEFIFKGLRRSINEIKSTEGIDICWVEEAQTVAESSWEILIPTIRKENSEIWISFNPDEATDPTYQRFVVHPPPDCRTVKVNYSDNPWLPRTLQAEIDWCRKTDTDAYRTIWLGETRVRSDAEVFGGKWTVDRFEAPADARFYYGADWGFSQDPTVLIRCFEHDQSLYVDYEAWGVGVDISDTPALFCKVPGATQWPIKADSSRPETISALRRAGFNISAARKWPGCVEDGIAALRAYARIIIHERCAHLIDEARFYRYQVDKKTGDVLPRLAPGHDHCWDAARYALDGLIFPRLGDIQSTGQSRFGAGGFSTPSPAAAPFHDIGWGAVPGSGLTGGY